VTNPGIEAIRPTRRQRVYDLVREAGVDVGGWADFAGGKSGASRNPRYCYEWAFAEPGKVVVLNLWHDLMKVKDGHVTQGFNLRKFAREEKKVPGRPPVVAARALRMDDDLQEAFANALPVRVIVCDGVRRDRTDPDSKPSSVKYRLLDPATWAVTAYDASTGRSVLTRGANPPRFVDQFTVIERPVTRGRVSGTTFTRSAEVRREVLERARGHCEWCGQRGFGTSNGEVYLETHHVEPLSEGGADSTRNVAALCANHHSEAHHGANRDNMRKELAKRIVARRPGPGARMARK